MSCRLLIVISLFALALTLPLSAREWTSAKGKVVEAHFVRVADKQVVLKLPSGKIRSIALKKLSQEDQTYIKELLEDQETKEEAEPSVTVWVNTRSGVYHYPGSEWYENTSKGELMDETEAKKNGYRPSKTASLEK